MTTEAATDLAALGEGFRARLAELRAGVAAMEAERRAPLAADFADQASDQEGAEALGALEDAALAEVAAIEAALGRIAAGRYGICERCGDTIPVARLRAVPATTHCIGCAT